MSIPNIIHCCWFGSKELPEYARKNQASWQKWMPHSQIILWNESNAPIQDVFLEICLSEKKYAFAADWTRLWALDQFGGYYLDMDLELIAPMDKEQHVNLQLAWESDYSLGSAFLASAPHHPIWKKAQRKMLEILREGRFETLSKILMDLIHQDFPILSHPAQIEEFNIGEIHFPKSYYYPFHHTEAFTPECIQDETRGIHYWEKSWFK